MTTLQKRWIVGLLVSPLWLVALPFLFLLGAGVGMVIVTEWILTGRWPGKREEDYDDEDRIPEDD